MGYVREKSKRTSRCYIVDGKPMSIHDVVVKYGLYDSEKYLYLLSKKKNHDKNCIQDFLDRNGYCM